MKTCTNCKQSKPLTDFNKGVRNKDGLQYECRECQKAKVKAHYHANKQQYYDRTRENNERIKEKIRALKEVPCTDCGKQYPWYVMQFDHLADKSFNVSYMQRHRMAWSKIEAEIAKCEVVCSNCHHERSFQRWSSKPWKNQFSEV